MFDKMRDLVVSAELAEVNPILGQREGTESAQTPEHMSVFDQKADIPDVDYAPIQQPLKLC